MIPVVVYTGLGLHQYIVDSCLCSMSVETRPAGRRGQERQAGLYLHLPISGWKVPADFGEGVWGGRDWGINCKCGGLVEKTPAL